MLLFVPPRFSACIASLAIVATLIVLLLPSAASATALPATISKNMTLTAAGNPYTGSTVTINSGVTVKAEPGVKFLVSSMIVKGTLKSEGRAESPVVFTSSAEKEPGESSIGCRGGQFL